MKKLFTSKSILAFMAIGSCFALSAQTVIKVGASQGAKQTTIQMAYDSIVPATLEGAFILELQADYDPTTEIYPIAFKAKVGASAANNIVIKPAPGVKKVIANPDLTKEFKNITVPAASTSLALPDVTGLTTDMYIVGNGITTITKISAIDASSNTITLATATPAAAQVPAITSQTLYAGPSLGSYTANSPGASGTKTIVFYGAKYITIDGVSRTGDTGLTIQNPNVISAQTLYFFGGASNITIRECFIRGANITSSFKGGNASDGNNAQIWFEGAGYSNTIENNDICDIEGKPKPISFFCFLNSSTAADQLTTINNNKIYNLSPTESSQTGNIGVFNFPSQSSPNCVVTNNRIFWTKTIAPIYKDFYIFGFGGSSAGSGNRVENNVVGGTDENNDGIAYFDFNKATFSIYNVNDNTTFKNNVVKNINVTCNTAATIYGIRFSANQPAKAPTDPNAWTKNTVKDITANFKVASSNLVGMTIASNANHPARNISGNIISDLVSTNLAANAANVVRGIQITGTFPTANQWNYSENKVFNLISGDEFSTAGNVVIGMDLIASTGTAERNLIYNLIPRAVSANTTSYAYGMRATGTNALTNGTVTGTIIKNNIIRLGVGVTNDCSMTALYQAAATDASHFVRIYNNTLYIGGAAPMTATKNTYGFYHTGVAGKNHLLNNIIANKRAIGNIEAHFAQFINVSLEITSSNYNMYQFGKYLGGADGSTTDDITIWRQTVAGDANSTIDNPLFVAPEAETPNMNIVEASPAKGTGIADALVTTDFNGFPRSTMDIGALAYGTWPTAVNTVKPASMGIYAAQKAIVITEQMGQTARIYTMNGQLVQSAKLLSNKENIALSNGLYLVRVGSFSTKVLVK